MPWWLAGLGGLLDLFKGNPYQDQLNMALRQMQMSPEEEQGIRAKAQGNVTSRLAGRGLLDSGIYGSAIAGIEPEIARIRGERARGSAGILGGLYAAEQNRPSFLEGLMPFVLRYGMTGFGGPNDWWWKGLSTDQPGQPGQP